MAIQAHIDSLKQKHTRLDRLVHEEEARAAPDDLVLHRLKAQKLNIKDEIERVSHAAREAA